MTLLYPQHSKAHTLSAACVILLFFAYVSPSHAAENTLYVNVKANGRYLNGIISVIQRHSMLYIPVQQLGHILQHDFASFSPLTRTNHINHIIALGNDSYASPVYFLQHYGITITLDTAMLQLHVSSPTPFAAEQQTLHQNKHLLTKDTRQHITLSTPYRLLSLPAIDVHSVFQHGSTAKEALYTVRAAGDIAYMQGNIQFTGKAGKNSLDQLRFQLRRTDKQHTLLGPFNAADMQWGDISPPAIPLIRNSGFGKGVFITNRYPGNSNQRHNSTTMEGFTYPGWLVELTRNGQYIDQQYAEEDGSYHFTDIALFTGSNHLVTTAYGPAGETETNDKTLTLHSHLLTESELEYTLTAIPEHPFYGLHLAYGLHPSHTLYLDVAHVTSQQQQSSIATYIGNSRTWGKWITHLHGTILPQDKLWSAAFHAQRSWDNTHIQFSGRYVSTPDALLIYTEPEISFAWRSHQKPFQWSWTQSLSKRQGWSHQLATHYKIQPLRFSHDWSIQDHGSIWQGNIAMRYHHRPWNIRLVQGYQIAPQASMQTLTLMAQYYLGSSHSLYGSIENHFDTNTPSRLSIGWAKHVPFARLYTDASVLSQKEFQLTLGLQFSLSPHSKQGWKISHQPRTHLANTEVLGFLDSNRNFIKDAEETGIADLRFMLNHNTASALETPSFGSLLPYQQHSITLDTSSLTHPFQYPAYSGIHYIPRPASQHQIWFPIHQGAEASGFCWQYINSPSFSSDSTPNPALIPFANVHLGLFNDKNILIQETLSAFDGYFAFNKLAPGTYHVKALNPKVARKLHLNKSQTSLKITEGQPYISDLLLQFRQGS